MLYLVTGTPGASKTAFVVTELDKLERQNYINVRKNKLVYEHNLKLFEKFKDEFTLYMYEEGSGSERKTIIEMLSEDYFDFLKKDYDDLRPDDYFKKTTRYNEIVDRINDTHGQQKFEFFQPVRTIYTNIKALKIPYTRPLIHDWRDAPDGSVFVLDEVQLVEPYSNKKSEDKIILDLTIHRHRGFDFYFITQAPRFLHPVVKELVGCHYHITRPYGWTPKVYQYGSARDNPNALINKVNCEAKFTFKPSDRIFTLYKSTTINTHKKRIPRFIFFILAFVLVMIYLFYHFAFRDNVFYDQVGNSLSGKPQASNTTETKPGSQSANTDEKKPDLNNECRKAENVSKPECVKWFDEISKNKSSVSSTGEIIQQVSYDSNNPYEFHPEPKIQVVDYPRLKGCAKKPNGQLVGIDQQGNIMPKIKQSDCQKWLNGERLFDYTKAPVQVQNNANSNNQINTANPVQQTVKQPIPQEMNYANNYVEPQLQRNPINGANTL